MTIKWREVWRGYPVVAMSVVPLAAAGMTYVLVSETVGSILLVGAALSVVALVILPIGCALLASRGRRKG